MYNGIGLQTPRGSGTNGYIQTNKFFVKPRPVRPEAKEFQNGQGAGGVTKKANPDILEHDRKRQIEVQLTVLRDDLADRGCSEAEIEDRVEHLRLRLDAESLRQSAKGQDNNNRFSDTQTHQIAAKKEKKLEAFKDALHIGDIKEGEAFDRELQEQRKQERILAREERERERQEKELENQKEEKRKEKEKKKAERAEQKEKERQEREKLKKEREEQKKKKIEDKKKERKEQEHAITKREKASEKRKDEDAKVGRSKDTHGRGVSLVSRDGREQKQCSKHGRRYTKTNKRSRKYHTESESDSYSDSGTSRDSDTSSGSSSSSYTDTSGSSSFDDSESDSQSAGSINSDDVDKRKLEKGKKKTKHTDERNSEVSKHKEYELLRKQSKTVSAKHTDGRRAPELQTERGSKKYNEDGRRLESEREYAGKGEGEESHKRKHIPSDDIDEDLYSKKRNMGRHEMGRRNNEDNERLEREHDRRHDDRRDSRKYEDRREREYDRMHDERRDDRRYGDRRDCWKYDGRYDNKIEQESFRPKESMGSPRKMDYREKEYYKDKYADRKY